MKKLLLIITIYLLVGCHTRKVSFSKVDSLVHRDSTYRDLSKTTTHRIGDTTFIIKKHEIFVQHKVWIPFTYSDSSLSLSIKYDTARGEILETVTKKAESLHQKIDETIVKENNILAHIKSDTHVLAKKKAIKSSGVSKITLVIGGLIIAFAIFMFLKIK